MSALSAFAAALTDGGRAAPQDLVTWNGSDPAQRFAVYRNNVMVSLIGALETTFPVVRALVGAAFFADMARVYVAQNPPRSVIMAQYGATFPAFLDGFPPVAELPYLGDVARLERARVTAYHASEATALGAEDFAAIPAEALADMHCVLHPSAGILSSRHAIVSLWGAHQGQGQIEDVDPMVPEEALIVRPRGDVHVLSLPPGVAVALAALQQGLALGAAVEAALDAQPQFSPAALFHILITSGVVVSASATGATA